VTPIKAVNSLFPSLVIHGLRFSAAIDDLEYLFRLLSRMKERPDANLKRHQVSQMIVTNAEALVVRADPASRVA
jgi:hypothetical protein